MRGRVTEREGGDGKKRGEWEGERDISIYSSLQLNINNDLVLHRRYTFQQFVCFVLAVNLQERK